MDTKKSAGEPSSPVAGSACSGCKYEECGGSICWACTRNSYHADKYTPKGKILTDESGQRWIVADERSDSFHFNAQVIKETK